MLCWPTMPATAPRSRGVKRRRSGAGITAGGMWRSTRVPEWTPAAASARLPDETNHAGSRRVKPCGSCTAFRLFE